MKLRNKLILSCAALAAVATTAVSSTFAWYTSNTEVTVNTISAVTKNSGSDLLMIADGQKITSTTVGDATTYNVAQISEMSELNWGTSVDNIILSGTATSATRVTPTELLPLAYTGTNANADTYSAASPQPTADTFGNATYYTQGGTAGAYTYTKATEFDADVTYYVKQSTLNATGGVLANIVEGTSGKKYIPTTDTAIGTGKTYYTHSAKGKFTAVENPTVANIATYYEESTLSSTNTAMVTGSSEGNSYLQFVLFLKNAGTGTKDLTMSISNLANMTGVTQQSSSVVLPTKSLLDPVANASLLGLNTSATSYGVDALRVAGLDVEIRRVTDGTLADALVDETVYYLHSATGGNFNDSVDPVSDGSHIYYNRIMETPLNIADAKNINTDQFASLNGGAKIKVQLPSAATSDNSLQLTFKLFLNGWDDACFDACQGQTFAFDLAFSV